MTRVMAALKRQRRKHNKGVPRPLTPDVVRITDAGARRSDDQDASWSLAEDSEPESEADVGTESGTG